MQQLWQWAAVDQFGKSRTYQAYGPDMTEAQMREFLQLNFRNVRITSLERLEDGQYKPATGQVEEHTYTHGHKARALAELGYKVATTNDPVFSRLTIPDRSFVRAIPRRPF